MMLSIKGLPLDTATDVSITRPFGSNLQPTKSLTIFNIGSGDHTIDANQVIVDGVVYVPEPLTQTVNIPYDTTAEVTVLYESKE